MNKKSYRNKRIKSKKSLDPSDIPAIPSGEEGLSGDSESGVGRGFVLPGEPVGAFDAGEDPYFVKKKRRRSKKINYEDLLSLFVNLADELDKGDDVAFANFADFMIKKVAQQKSLDYSDLFKELLIKVVDSDILDKNKILIALTSHFNRLLRLHTGHGKQLDEAKMEAYQSSVLKAEEYVG